MAGAVRELQVGTIIDRANLSALQYTAFLLCFFVALFDGYDIGTVSSMAPLIADHLGVSVKSFGPLFSAGFIGMAIGAILVGPTADRIGRKWTVVGSTFVFGLFTLLIAFAPSLSAFVPASLTSMFPFVPSLLVIIVLRLIAGIGLGGALPNIIALTSEYAPQHSRAFLVTLMACGIPLGGLLAPLLGSYIGPTYGWNASFILGGALPLCLCAALVALLPESLRFMVVRNRPVAQILAVLARIDASSVPSGDASSIRVTLGDEDTETRIAVSELFRHGRLPTTLLLWAVYFCTLLTALFIVSWLPAVLRSTGLTVFSALLMASLFSAGGLIGSPALGRLMDRFGPYSVLIVAYILGTLCTAYVGSAQGTAMLGIAIFTAGFFIFGAQACIQALAAILYPTAVRASGVGWAFGIGRLGSIAGPLLGGFMIAAQWSLANVFIAAAIPALISAVCSAAMWLLQRRDADAAHATLLAGTPIH